LLLLLVLPLLLAACSGAKQPARDTPSPAGPALVLIEEHGDSAIVLLEQPDNPAQRRRVASIEHRAGYGISATVSPDGRSVAYAVLPRDGVDPDSDGQLWLLPLDGRTTRRLAVNIDLRSDLLWSPDSAWVTYERVPAGPAVLELRRVNVQGAGDQLLASDTDSARWYIAGYAPDGGSLSFVRIDGSGTAFASARPGVAPRASADALPGSSRGFILSSKGCAALLALTQEGDRSVYRAYGCAGSDYVRLTSGGVEDVGIAWNPHTDTPTVGVVPGTAAAPPRGQNGASVIVPASGFDVPLAWSRDGRWLALEHYSGATSDDPGSATIQTRSETGARRNAAGDGPLQFAGWSTPN
jgi:dipeptidyl aminopeptidase/acylaminoacyl peptidase